MKAQSRMTMQKYQLFCDQAENRRHVFTLKQLSRMTGFSEAYCQRMLKKIQKGVSIKIQLTPENETDTLRG
jgi:hypothetical protein